MAPRIPAIEYNFRAVGRGTVASLAVAVILSLCTGIMLYFTRVQEIWMPAIATAVMVLSILVGSAVAAQKAGHRGLLHGGGVAIFFFLLTLVFTLPLAAKFSMLVATKKFIYAILAGFVGGILGVGLTNR